MRWAQKTATRVQAWQLGKNTSMEVELLKSGKLRLRPDGNYEVFSLEATCKTGEIAKPGDYIKIDNGSPYPNSREFFEKAHIYRSENWYEQITQPVQIWTADEPVCPEIEYLLDQKRLQLHPDTPERYFSAKLWGTVETAAQNAVIVFYEINRDENGAIVDIDFNFVERTVFENTYATYPSN